MEAERRRFEIDGPAEVAHELGTTDVVVQVYNEAGAPVPAGLRLLDDQRVHVFPPGPGRFTVVVVA